MKALSNNRNRVLVEFSKTKFPGSRPTLSYLKSSVILRNNSGVYQFSFNKMDSTENIGEKKLGQQDAFIADKIGFFLATRNASEAGTELLVTYPAPVFFPNVTNAPTLAAGSPASFRNSHLQAVYNGEYKINLAGTDVFESLDMQRHLHIPEVQDQAAPAYTDPDQGLLLIEPYMVLRGNTKHYVEVKLPVIPNMLIEAVRQTTNTADKEHILVAYVRGAFINSGANK